jgi:hypothetical protein
MGNLTDGVVNAKTWWKSQTAIGIVLMLIPQIAAIINPDLVIDASGAADALFNGAEQIASNADAAWVTATNTFGEVLILLGIRKAAGGAPLKLK